MIVLKRKVRVRAEMLTVLLRTAKAVDYTSSCDCVLHRLVHLSLDIACGYPVRLQRRERVHEVLSRAQVKDPGPGALGHHTLCTERISS